MRVYIWNHVFIWNWTLQACNYVNSSWPGKKNDVQDLSAVSQDPQSPVAVWGGSLHRQQGKQHPPNLDWGAIFGCIYSPFAARLFHTVKESGGEPATAPQSVSPDQQKCHPCPRSDTGSASPEPIPSSHWYQWLWDLMSAAQEPAL